MWQPINSRGSTWEDAKFGRRTVYSFAPFAASREVAICTRTHKIR